MRIIFRAVNVYTDSIPFQSTTNTDDLDWSTMMAILPHQEQLFGTRKVGRPRLRLTDCVVADALPFLDIRNCRAAVQTKEI